MRIYFIYDRCQQGGIYIKTYSVCGPEDTFGFGACVRNNRHCMQDIWEIIKKAVFVAAAMLGPMYVLSRLSATGNIGYGLENSFVYFSMVMICFLRLC